MPRTSKTVSLSPGCTTHRVAFGAEQLGGFQWGRIDIGEIEQAITDAVAMGNVVFDTADCYGKGESERRLGRALQGARENVYLATKFGVRFDERGGAYYDNDPSYAEAALDASLRRLDTDHVDLYQAHWPDHRTPLPTLFERLERLREQGSIGSYGVCNFRYRDLLAIGGQWPGWSTFSGQFSLLHASSKDDINALCLERKLTFLSWGSLGHGLLSGKYNADSTFGPDDRRDRPHYIDFHGQRFVESLRLVDQLKALACEARCPVVQLAIRYVLETIPSSIALVGVKSKAQFRQNIEALTLELQEGVSGALLSLPDT